MAAVVLTLTRVFRCGGRDFDDPNTELTPAEVLRHLGRSHPRLLGAKIVDPIVEGDKHVYEIREANFGDKG